jgi:cytochrome b subunit of formate dehydrogenase
MAISESSAREAAISKKEPDYFTRFSIGQRVEHAVMMVTFTILSVTGLAQRFYGAGWAEWVILSLGGIEYIRLIHRAFGFLFTLSVVYHFGYLVYSLFVRHSKPSMLPDLKDVRDIVTALRYGFGFADKPPQFGRFDYRQKFEYWGIIFGSIIIITTGFILVFPLAVTKVLPGQVVAAAVEFHGYEATLAVLTIVIWHLYDVIFKPGIFPADTSIFTGKISRERMLEEHPLEYAELVGTKANEETGESSLQELPSESPSG